MLFHAERVTPIAQERIDRPCSTTMRRAYQTFIRVALVLMIAPVSLGIVTCVFHVPFIPVLVMFVIMAMMGPIERVMLRLALRFVWPVHSWWLVRKEPERVSLTTRRLIEHERVAAKIHVDPDAGQLRVGFQRWDLSRPHRTAVERAEDGGAQLRVRLHTPTQAPLVVGARVPDAVLAELGQDYQALPRKEGAAMVMEWDAFCALMAEWEQIDAGADGIFPALLHRAVSRWSKAPAPVLHAEHARVVRASAVASLAGG